MEDGDRRASEEADGGSGIRSPGRKGSFGPVPYPEGRPSREGQDKGTAGTHGLVQETCGAMGRHRDGDRSSEARPWDGKMPVQGISRKPDERLLGGPGLEHQERGRRNHRIRGK